MRADRLLKGMHKVVRHDLPNEVVALRSLLQLLVQEEATRLSDTGREYLRRLQNAARRTGEMTRFLKEMENLQTLAASPKTIVLAELARELQGDLRQRFPVCVFEFSWQWDVPTLFADPHLLAHSLREIFSGLLKTRAKHVAVAAVSAGLAQSVEVRFTLDEILTNTDSPLSDVPRALEDRTEVILAREWLALTGVDLKWEASSDGVTRFSLFVPNP